MCPSLTKPKIPPGTSGEAASKMVYKKNPNFNANKTKSKDLSSKQTPVTELAKKVVFVSFMLNALYLQIVLQNSKPSHGKGLWWSDGEVDFMLEIIHRTKPSGGNMWDTVAELYNSKHERSYRRFPENLPFRDKESIKDKFKKLKNAKKPTGDPDCPPQVRRAKRIAKDIEEGVGVFQSDQSPLNSSSENESENGASEDSDDDYDSESETGAISPIMGRQQLQSLIVPETFVAIEGDAEEVNDAQVVGASPPLSQDAADQKKDGQGEEPLLPRASVINTKNKHAVPVRLGMSTDDLQAVAAGLAGQKKKRKKSVPENPSTAKKRTLSIELKQADEAYQAAVDSRENEKQRRHAEEMKRLDNLHTLEEMKYRAEAARSNAMLSAVLMAATSFSAISNNPHFARVIQSLAAPLDDNHAPNQ
jgi:hypothetical protein